MIEKNFIRSYNVNQRVRNLVSGFDKCAKSHRVFKPMSITIHDARNASPWKRSTSEITRTSEELLLIVMARLSSPPVNWVKKLSVLVEREIWPNNPENELQSKSSKKERNLIMAQDT